jgi:hypothetical protein
MLSATDWPRQSKISSCAPIAAKFRMSPAMSSGLPEKGREPSGQGMPVIVERRLIRDRQCREIAPLGFGQLFQRIDMRAHLLRG